MGMTISAWTTVRGQGIVVGGWQRVVQWIPGMFPEEKVELQATNRWVKSLAVGFSDSSLFIGGQNGEVRTARLPEFWLTEYCYSAPEAAAVLALVPRRFAFELLTLHEKGLLVFLNPCSLRPLFSQETGISDAVSFALSSQDDKLFVGTRQMEIFELGLPSPCLESDQGATVTFRLKLSGIPAALSFSRNGRSLFLIAGRCILRCDVEKFTTEPLATDAKSDLIAMLIGRNEDHAIVLATGGRALDLPFGNTKWTTFKEAKLPGTPKTIFWLGGWRAKVLLGSGDIFELGTVGFEPQSEPRVPEAIASCMRGLMETEDLIIREPKAFKEKIARLREKHLQMEQTMIAKVEEIENRIERLGGLKTKIENQIKKLANGEIECLFDCGRPQNCLFLPCKHICFCEECAANVDHCQVCNTPIDQKVKIFL